MTNPDREMPPPDAPYRDPARSVDERVVDLLARMSIEEKAGQLFHTIVAIGAGGSIADQGVGGPGVRELVGERHLTHLNVLAAPSSAGEMARWHNRLQELASSTRLGIPVTVSSDPRHGFTDNPGAGLLAGPFSQWPETLGLAATRDADLVERFADIARQEYLAVGIRTALHSQVDLATEPRWARTDSTFGEDADLTTQLGVAYVRGFQATGDVARAAGLDTGFGPGSVSTMTKHFPGGGPQADGEDAHFDYGREQVYPGGAFDLHLKLFLALIAAGTRALMPYYGMPVDLVLDGEPVEPVGFGFNRQIVTGLPRDRLGFTGIVCSDWGLVTDGEIMGEPFPARAWARSTCPQSTGPRRSSTPASTSSAARRAPSWWSSWSAPGGSRRTGSTSRCTGCSPRSSCSDCSTTPATSTPTPRPRWWEARRSAAPVGWRSRVPSRS